MAYFADSNATAYWVQKHARSCELIKLNKTPFSGIIKGLELNRQRKDDCLLMIDNLLTKMILNHKGVKVPGHCVDTTFQTIDSEFWISKSSHCPS